MAMQVIMFEQNVTSNQVSPLNRAVIEADEYSPLTGQHFLGLKSPAVQNMDLIMESPGSKPQNIVMLEECHEDDMCCVTNSTLF